MPKKASKKKEQDSEEEQELEEDSEVQEESEFKEESGVESDLEEAEEGFQEKSFREFFRPVRQGGVSNLDELRASEQPALDDMSQLGFAPSPKEEKSAMNYDIQHPLKIGNKNEYHAQRASSPDDVNIPSVNVNRVEFESVGRGRMRIGSEFDFRGFQSATTQGMGMSGGAENEEYQPLETPGKVDMNTRTAMDTEPNFKPRKDYKNR